MDWNANLRPPFVFRPENSFNFLFNYDHYPGVEMKYPVVAQPSHAVVGGIDKSGSCYGNQLEKKKRLTNEQLDSLESCFQEDIKLDPERKMKLARELGLQPRQIAVWFQNRRARWKAKQVERLYDVLKQEFDAVSKEKQKLQEEVSALKALLSDQAMKKQVSRGQTEISGEETVESTPVENQRSGKVGETSHQQNLGDQGNYVFTVDDYNPAMPPYWGSFLPSYP